MVRKILFYVEIVVAIGNLVLGVNRIVLLINEKRKFEWVKISYTQCDIFSCHKNEYINFERKVHINW